MLYPVIIRQCPLSFWKVRRRVRIRDLEPHTYFRPSIHRQSPTTGIGIELRSWTFSFCFMLGGISGINASPHRSPHGSFGDCLRSSHVTFSSPPSRPLVAMRMREVLLGEDEEPQRHANDGSFPIPDHQPTLRLLQRMSTKVKSLFLPEGYPDSVTPDYLPYQLWSMPTHITVWHRHCQTSHTML